MRKNLPSCSVGGFKAIGVPAVIASILLSMFSVLSFGQVQLLKDANPAEVTHVNEYRWLTNAGTVMYYISNNELWKSNGTPAGTIRIKAFKSISELTPAGSSLYFAANDGTTGTELWKTNGTPEGTVRVRDIIPGTNSSEPRNLVWAGSQLFFTARNNTYGRELWRSNGTSTGTGMVRDINTGSAGSEPTWIVNVNGTVYFEAQTAAHGFELWKSNGTSGGTVMIKDIFAGSGSSYPGGLVNINGTVYFAAQDNTTGRELWKTNGTAAGTVRVKDIYPGAETSRLWNLTNVNGVLFFSATNGTSGFELWKSNGTATGTVMVKDMNPGAAGSENTDEYMGLGLANFTNINGVLYFTASKGTENYIGRSDGTSAGTVRLQTIPGVDYPDQGGLAFHYPRFNYLNGYVYFFNGDPADPNPDDEAWYYLWKLPYKGTGFAKVKTFYRDQDYYGGGGAPAEEMITWNGALYMTGRINSGGYEFIKSDGTTPGTVTIKDSYAPTGNSIFRGPLWRFESQHANSMITASNGIVYWRAFAASSPTQDIWRTDGTATGTYKISSTLVEYDWEVVGKTLFFAKPEADGAWSLYKTQGTTATTIAVSKSNYPDAKDPAPIRMTNANGTLFWTNARGEVWKSNGTSTTTVRIADFDYVFDLYYGGASRLIIVVETAAQALQIWKHENNATTLVKTVRSQDGALPYYNPSLVWNNVLYFVANDLSHGNEVWRTDGTTAGTYMVYDINRSDYNAINNEGDIFDIATNGTKLFISAFSPDSYHEGFYIVQPDFHQSSSTWTMVPAPMLHMEFLNGKLFAWGTMTQRVSSPALYVYNPDHMGPGPELVQPFTGNGHEMDINRIGNTFYWSSDMADRIWRSDGTDCGTFALTTGHITDHFPMEPVGNSLIFDGYAALTGNEPYIYRNVTSVTGGCATMAATSTARTETADDSEVMTPYPNPFTEGFTLRVNSDQDEVSDVAIYTTDGLPVEHLRNVRSNTDYERVGERWPPGSYIVRVSRAKGVTTHIVIKK